MNRPVRLLAVLAAALAGTSVATARAAPAAEAADTTAVGGPGNTQCARPATTVDPKTPWAQQWLDAERAWVLTRGGSTLVAVVDTGVSAHAPALAGAVLTGRDVLSGGAADNDCSGHGTFVAGLLAARPTAAAGLAGVAPAVRLLPIRVTDNPDQVDPARLAAGIRAAADAAAQVIAVPVSTPTASAALRAAVAYAERRDALVVAAAETPTNAPTGPGADPNPPAYPAALPGVLAVAPIGPNGPTDAISVASNPDLAAPGSNLTSIAPAGSGQITADGHGLAVAFVAGAAALVRSYRPVLTAAAVRHRLEATADHPTGHLPDPKLGYGMVDPLAAVATALPEESDDPAPTPRPAPIQVPLTAPTDPQPARLALAASAALAVVAGIGGLLAATVARGRRRRWRPAGAPDPRPSSREGG